MSTLVKPLTHFIRHLLGMCAAMCIGLAVLDAVFFGLARILGYANPLVELRSSRRWSSPSPWRCRWPSGCAFGEWRGNHLGNVRRQFALAIVLIAAFWLGLITAGPRGLFGWQHELMLPAMVIPMLFRLDVYTEHVTTLRKRQPPRMAAWGTAREGRRSSET